MAVTLYATREDVRAAFEGTIPDNAKANARLDSLLRRACGMLGQLVPSLDRRMAQGQIDPEVPAGMVVEAVLRVWRNPAGATQQGVGPFQLSLNARAALNEIHFDPAELARLVGDHQVPRSIQVAIPAPQSPSEPRVDAPGGNRAWRVFPGSGGPLR